MLLSLSLTSTLRKQLAFMLGRQQVFLELDETECEEVEDIADIMSNVHLNNNFLALAREVRGANINFGCIYCVSAGGLTFCISFSA